MSEKIVQLNEEVIKGQLKELARGSVEETLNELLEQEAEKLTQAARYERSEARQGYIAPNTEWNSQAKSVLAPGMMQFATTTPEQLQLSINDLRRGIDEDDG